MRGGLPVSPDREGGTERMREGPRASTSREGWRVSEAETQHPVDQLDKECTAPREIVCVRARERERESERKRNHGPAPSGREGTRQRRSNTATNSARIVRSRASGVSVQFKSKSEYAKTKAATKRRTQKTVRDI